MLCPNSRTNTTSICLPMAAKSHKWQRHFHGPICWCRCRRPNPFSVPLLFSLSVLFVPTAHWAQQAPQPTMAATQQFFQPIIAFKAAATQQQQQQQQESVYNAGAGQTAAATTMKMTQISRFDPTLKTKSSDGYLSASAGQGTFVRTAPSINAPPLQILVEDRDLLPGMPSAVYHYILTGYGAERFAVDHQGTLYLNVDELDTDATGTPVFVLHVMAKEVDTTPQRSSAPISLTVHVLDDDNDDDNDDGGEETEQEQDDQQLQQQQQQQQQGGLTLPQSVYVANVSASAGVGQQRVIAQVKAHESDSISPVFYRIVEVSDGAANAFRYDQAKHELIAIGPLYPGHRYKVVIEARDTDGLVGHAVVLVQAVSDHPSQPIAAAAASSSSVSLISGQQSQAASQMQPLFSSDQLHPIPSAFMSAAKTVPPAVLPPSSQLSLSQKVRPADQVTLIASPGGAIWQPISNNNENKNDQQTMKPFWWVDPTTTTTLAPPQSNPMLIQFTTTTAAALPSLSATEQTLFVELSESAPIGSPVTLLGNEYSAGKVYFVLLNDGNGEAKFGMEDEQQTGTVITKGTLDREQTAHYTLRIEARSRLPIDQLLYVTILHIKVLDANDNAPQFGGSHPIRFSVQLDDSPLNSNESMRLHMNLLLGRVEVRDPDQGQNGNVTLSVMPPLDRLFLINDNGEVRVNGALSAAHLGEHQLTLRAVDSGEPPLESRTVVSVRIDGRFASPIRETLLLGGPPPPVGGSQSAAASVLPDGMAHFRVGIGQQHGSTVPNSDEARPPLGANSASALSSSADYESGGVGGDQNGKLVPLSSSLSMPNAVRPPFTRVDPRLNSALLWAMSSSTVRPPLSMSSGINFFSPMSSAGKNVGTEKNADKSPQLASLSPSSTLFLTTVPVPSSSSSSTTTTTTIITTTGHSSASSEELINSGRPRLAPVFDSAELKVFVEENEGQMELTRLHAHYPDGGPGPITYTLRAGDQSIFSVDPISGKVTLLRALDAESEPNQQPPVYRLTVGTAEQEKQDQFVTEPGLAHSCEMIIHVVDINDWIPNFAQGNYEFKVAESAANGTIVGQVVAFDQDLTAPNNKIRYELDLLRSSSSPAVADQSDQFSSDNQPPPLQIDAWTGQIVVTNAQRLANLARSGGQNPLHLVAKAIDGGLEGTEQNGTAQVDIVVVPRGEGGGKSGTTTPGGTTSSSSSTLPENSVEEAEGGGEAEGGDEAAAAAARSNSLSLESRHAPSAPTAASPSLASAASSSSSSTSVQYRPLSVAPMQFVARTFRASVAEGKRPPVLIQTLEADNKPSDTRFTICAIREGNIRGPFSVTPNARGDCELRTQMLLDRESVAEYRLNVSIQNGIQTDWAIVTVTVLDTNDNRPKFVDEHGIVPTATAATTMAPNAAASSSSSAGGDALPVYFAVLPLETESAEPFFSLTARDADTVESGNGLITYALDDQMPSAQTPTVGGTSDATFFGINATTGQLFPQKKASEVAQLTRRDYFRVTASACDNPLDATNQRLCSRATVAISLLNGQHTFILLFAGVGAEQIRHNEKEIAKALQQFIEPCPTAKLLSVEDQQRNDAEDEAEQKFVSVVMYALDSREQKLCQKHEFQKLFTESAKQRLASTMREWGADLLDVFSGGVEDGRTARSGGGEDGASAAGDGIAALLFPIDWNGTSTMLITIGLAVALVALVGLCALFIFRTRHHQQVRRRAQQQMRRRRGFSGAGGLLTVSNMKGLSAADGGCLFSGIPSYCAGGTSSSNNNNAINGSNVYLPNAAPLGGGGGGGTGRGAAVGIPSHCPFERGNKCYESQLLELPIGDDDYNSGANAPFAATAHGHGMRCIGGRGGGAVHDDRCTRGAGAAKKVFRANASSSSPPHRQLLHHSPPHQQQGANSLQQGNRRKPHATASVPADCFQRYYSPPHHAPATAATNHEGDFSIDESFYAANGQRCIY